VLPFSFSSTPSLIPCSPSLSPFLLPFPQEPYSLLTQRRPAPRSLPLHALRFLCIVHVAQRQATPIIHGVQGEEGCCHRSGLGHALICHKGGPPPPGPSSPSDPPHRRAATAKRAHGALRSTARVGHHRRQGPVHPQIHRIGGPPQPKGPMAPSDLPHGRATTAAWTHTALRSTTREGHCHRRSMVHRRSLLMYPLPPVFLRFVSYCLRSVVFVLGQ
jgi:hypothetical protein